MYIMILYKILNKNLFLTEWKDAPCPPGAAPLQCALFLGMWDLASQLLLVAFIYNLPFLYNFSCSQAIKLTLDAGLSSCVWVPVFQQGITGVMA